MKKQRNLHLLSESPDLLGIHPEKILNFIEYLERQKIELSSLMILRHGKIGVEGYWSPYKKEQIRSIYSLTKAFTAAAMGFLIQEGRLSLSDTVVSFFPQYIPDNPSPNLLGITVKHLLTMTSGHDKEPNFRAKGDWVAEFFKMPVPYPPGTHFFYNNLGTHLLSEILYKITGLQLSEYLATRLFAPLGITEYDCYRNHLGHEYGAGGLLLKTEDLAKFSLLFLQDGVFNGRQILPPGWANEMTRTHVAQSYANFDPEGRFPHWSSGYGYQTWMCKEEGLYRFEGIYGQMAIVIPQKDAVIITTGATYRINRLLEGIYSILLPAFEDQPIVECGEALGKLTEKLEKLKLAWSKGGSPTSAQQALIRQKQILFPPNDYSFLPERRFHNLPLWENISENYTGIERCSLDFTENGCYFNYFEGTTPNRLHLGSGCIRKRGELKLFHNRYEVVSTGSWVEENTFAIDIRFLQYSHHRRIYFSFFSDHVEVCFCEKPKGNGSYDIPEKVFFCTYE